MSDNYDDKNDHILNFLSFNKMVFLRAMINNIFY